jgi:hypothetical protein
MRVEGLGKSLAASHIVLHFLQKLLEMNVLGPAGDELQALKDRIAGPKERHQLLVEHDKILVLDSFFEGQGRRGGFFPVFPDGKNAEPLCLEVLPTFLSGRGQK